MGQAFSNPNYAEQVFDHYSTKSSTMENTNETDFHPTNNSGTSQGNTGSSNNAVSNNSTNDTVTNNSATNGVSAAVNDGPPEPPVPALFMVVPPSTHFEPTEAEKAAAALSTTKPKRPKIATLFNNVLNDFSDNIVRWEITQLVIVTRRLLKIEVCHAVRCSTIIKHNSARYDLSMKENGIALAAIKFAYGHDITLNEFQSINHIYSKFQDNKQVMFVYNNILIPYLRYLFLWVIPRNSNIKYLNVRAKNVYEFQNSLVSGTRRKFPVWSNRFIKFKRQNSSLSINDSAICAGHLLDYICWYDAHVPGLFERCLEFEQDLDYSQDENRDLVRVYMTATEMNKPWKAELLPQRYWSHGEFVKPDESDVEDETES